MPFMDDALGPLLLGSVLIGLAAGLLTRLTGRVMSASGMIGSLLGGAEGLAATSIAFIGGIAAAPLIMTGIGFLPRVSAEAGLPLLVIGGLLVGFGARFGGASLGGALTGMVRHPRQTAPVLGMIGAGAAIGLYLKRLLVDGGMA